MLRPVGSKTGKSGSYFVHVPKQDIETLQNAGIDLDALATAAATFLRTHPIYLAAPVRNALSEAEERFLREGGALGVGGFDARIIRANVTAVAGEYAQMVTTALTQKDAADLLRVSTSRVRQRIDARTLYAIEGPAGRVCPGFQFADQATLPGLEVVLPAIRKDAHPVAVQRFFLIASCDLETEELGGAVSPRDWLRTGHSPEPIILLASEL